MTAAECDAHDAWRDRAIAVGGPLEPLVKFADWYQASRSAGSPWQ